VHERGGRQPEAAAAACNELAREAGGDAETVGRSCQGKKER